jgi:putative transposase
MITAMQQGYPALSIRSLCRLTAVSRSWFYDRDETPSEQEVALRATIEDITLAFPGYGYRRVTHALARDGWTVNHKRVLRIMQEESLLCQLKRRFIATTESQHGYRRYANLLTDRVLTAPNEAWVADITYIRLPAAFVYLAAILDAYSRYCVGWALSRWIDTELALAALDRALLVRQPPAGLIHHSDQGVQYASTAYVERLAGIGARVSMAGKGNPYENAKAERFFRTLKYEEVYLKDYRDFDEAHANISSFIDEVYNAKRLHSSLGYRPPAEFEAGYARLKLEVSS